MALFSTEGAAGFRRDRAMVMTASASKAPIVKSRRRRFLRRARSGLATSILVLASCLFSGRQHTVAAVCDRRSFGLVSVARRSQTAATAVGSDPHAQPACQRM